MAAGLDHHLEAAREQRRAQLRQLALQERLAAGESTSGTPRASTSATMASTRHLLPAGERVLGVAIACSADRTRQSAPACTAAPRTASLPECSCRSRTASWLATTWYTGKHELLPVARRHAAARADLGRRGQADRRRSSSSTATASTSAATTRPARALAAAGFSVRGLDLRGHGQSAGVRGFCNRFDEYLDDVDASRHARARRGAAAVRARPLVRRADRAALRARAIRGSSPGWCSRRRSGSSRSPSRRPRCSPARSLRGSTRSWRCRAGLKGDDVARDPEIAALYDRDPLNNKNATARWFTEASAAQEALLTRAPELTLPLLLLVGEADKIAAAPQARVVFERIGSKDKTLRMLAGQYPRGAQRAHSRRANKLSREIVEWLRAHASAASATEGKVARHGGVNYIEDGRRSFCRCRRNVQRLRAP